MAKNNKVYCRYFILFELNKCYVDTNIVMYFVNNTFYQNNNVRRNRKKEHKTDSDKSVRLDNIKSVLSRENENRNLYGTTYITFQGVPIYIISRREDVSI